MKYDLDYYEFLLKKDRVTAEEIAKLRWDFIMDLHPQVILDYGCGISWFRTYRPKNIIVDSYDIAPFPQTGILHKEYDIICFWDVLEHIPDWNDIVELLKTTKYIAMTIPIKPKEVAWKDWHHLRPLHHLHWFDLELLDALFDYLGFIKIRCGQPECPPRKDIYSLIYKRKEMYGKEYS